MSEAEGYEEKDSRGGRELQNIFCELKNSVSSGSLKCGY